MIFLSGGDVVAAAAAVVVVVVIRSTPIYFSSCRSTNCLVDSLKRRRNPPGERQRESKRVLAGRAQTDR
jgi:hypothetical protein